MVIFGGEKMNNSIKELFQNVEQITGDIIRDSNENIAEPRAINIENIIQGFNIKVLYQTMEDKQAGAIFIRKDGSCIIVINDADALVRKRFTLAHEFGHYVSYSYQKKTGTIVDNKDGTHEEFEAARNEESELGTNVEEVFANKFASCILMPKNLVIKAQEETTNIKELAKRFQVSQQAMEIRINTIG